MANDQHDEKEQSSDDKLIVKEESHQSYREREHHNQQCPPKTFRQKWRETTFDRQVEISVLGVGGVIAILLLVTTCAQWQVATKANSIAQDTAKRQLRAYVSIKDQEGYHVNLAPNVPIVQMLVIKNVGASPAFNVETVARIWPFPYPLPPDVDITPPPGSTPKSNGTIFPTQHIKTYPKAIVGEAVLNQIQDPNGPIRLYIVANVTYEDIYGVSHYTHYCTYIDRRYEQPLYCGRYNDTDDKRQTGSQ